MSRTSSSSLRSDVTLIELDDEPVGLAVHDRAGFRFFAATSALNRLDAQLFCSLKALRHAVAEVRGSKRKQGAGTVFHAAA